jgi:lysophospholipase L1-like esterase
MSQLSSFLLSALLMLPSTLLDARPGPDKAGEAAPHLVSATAPEFRYEGRFDLRDPLGPVIIWQSSRIRVDFEGERLALVFDEIRGQNVFDVQVDAHTRVMPVQAGSDLRRVYLPPLGKGRHHLTISKRTESLVGLVRFRGLELEGGARVFAPADPAYRLRMEFVGDSITAGACNEDGNSDQWDNRISHNSILGYAAMTAEAFKADHRNISASGMGVCTGYLDITAGEVWDRIYPRVTSPWAGDSKTSLPHLESPKADFAAWQPDVVFVNLGENDQSATEQQKLPFPASFVDNYAALIKAIRQAYPRAHIVLLRGGMTGGAKALDLCKAWETAVARLTASDPAIHPFVFGHWSITHPRVPDNRAMADELIAWLTWQDFMKPWSAARR